MKTVSKSVYHAFGLNIESSVPFLDMPTTKGTPEVVIRYGKVPDQITNAKITGVRYQAKSGEFLLRVDNVARYYVTKGERIDIEKEPGAADEEVLLFLMGSAMGSLLHQRNILPLHASAVETNGEGVLFLGPSSIGKSTLAAGFGKRGRRLLADDVCAVTAKNGSAPSIIPGFPRLKLWHDALKKLKHGAKGLHRVRLDKDFKKYFVPFGHADNTPAPVRSIFILDKTNTDRFEAVQLKGVDKISPLITNTYRPRFLEGLGGKQEHFKQCAAVADKAVVTRITRPQQRFLLDELMDLVERYW